MNTLEFVKASPGLHRTQGCCSTPTPPACSSKAGLATAAFNNQRKDGACGTFHCAWLPQQKGFHRLISWGNILRKQFISRHSRRWFIGQIKRTWEGPCWWRLNHQYSLCTLSLKKLTLSLQIMPSFPQLAAIHPNYKFYLSYPILAVIETQHSLRSAERKSPAFTRSKEENIRAGRG